MLHSIIIPCYKSSQTIREVVELTSTELDRLGRTEYEFILVDDYSPDEGATLRELKALAADYPFVKAISLAKNSGQHNAVMAGLNYAQGDLLIAMDDDMQTHPSQLHFLLEEIEKGYDIVYGYYPDKKHSAFRNFGSYLNYLTVRILIGKPKDMKTSSYWVIRKFVRDYVIQYQSPYTHLQGLFLRTTRNISSVPIKHFEREVGQSGYTLKKLIQYYGILCCPSAIIHLLRILLFYVKYSRCSDNRNTKTCKPCYGTWMAFYDVCDLLFLRTHHAIYGNDRRIPGQNVPRNEQTATIRCTGSHFTRQS